MATNAAPQMQLTTAIRRANQFERDQWFMAVLGVGPGECLMVYDQPPNNAESWLKDAYADGRISESEFDRRIGQILSAVTRKELNEAFYGLVQIPTPSRAPVSPKFGTAWSRSRSWPAA